MGLCLVFAQKTRIKLQTPQMSSITNIVNELPFSSCCENILSNQPLFPATVPPSFHIYRREAPLSILHFVRYISLFIAFVKLMNQPQFSIFSSQKHMHRDYFSTFSLDNLCFSGQQPICSGRLLILRRKGVEC